MTEHDRPRSGGNAGEAKKAVVTFDGVPLAATGAIAWKLQTGTRPYTAIFEVPNADWDENLKAKIIQPLTLSVTDARGVTQLVKELSILHIVPGSSPYVTAFMVADRRWRWPYKLIARDYNVPKKTGDRTARNVVPVEATITADEYDFRPYSLFFGSRWTPKNAVIDVLTQLEGGEGDDAPLVAPGAGGGSGGKKKPGGDPIKSEDGGGKDRFIIESFPIEDSTASSIGGYSLQNVMLRDQGDVALARLLSLIPGAEVYVDTEGFVRVFDGADLPAAEEHFNQLPPSTWDGDKAEFIDRTKIRPNVIRVHYTREVEMVLEYTDDFDDLQLQPERDLAFIQNVIPTTDPSTRVSEWDGELKRFVVKEVPAGTWLEVTKWLIAMQAIRPVGSLRWDFNIISQMWLKGDLDGALGGKGLDEDPTGNVALRIQALKQHFRQTFRINRQYMERLRTIEAVRVALLDPVTGQRAPAAVWGQACSIPTTKGKLMAARKDKDKAKVFRNLDYLAASDGGKSLIDTPPGPTRVNIIDKDLGIFRLEWIISPYGTIESFVPGNLVEGNPANSVKRVISRYLGDQDKRPMGVGMRVDQGTNGIFMRDQMRYKVLLTIVPAAPNNVNQFHIEELGVSDISEVFRAEFSIERGTGPPLDVFIPPGELTARFAWNSDQQCPETMIVLLGLRSDDPNSAGLVGNDLPGFVFINEQREIAGHAMAVAAEAIAPFADNLMGRVATRLPDGGLSLKGNLAGATLQVSAAPDAKVNVIHDYPGQQKPINRLAMMPEAARRLVLGILPYKE